MTVFNKAVFACAFAVLTAACSLPSNVNENNINDNAISYNNLPRKDEIEKIRTWLRNANQLGTVVASKTMRPIFNLEGASSLVKSDAAFIMDLDTLYRLRRTAYFFGDTLVINDAIAKAGTSRENHTPNSEHFSGRAVDISIKHMTDAEKIRLVESALEAGFTGFGFGRNILHVDTGRNRWWAYGNSTFGGLPVGELGSMVK